MSRLLSLILIPLTATVCLCRFTVRDVGFVDLGDEPYRLYAFLAPGDAADSFRQLGTGLLLDSNIQLEVVDPADDSHPAIAQRTLADAGSTKQAVLVAADGRAIPIALGNGEAGGTPAALDAICESPLRRELRDLVIDHFCVVVLAEGKDREANLSAETAVQTAFDELAKVFDRMPKDVGELPSTLTIPHSDRARESLLLFGLGFDTEQTESPTIAVVFGRGRRVGPVLHGAAITSATVFGILANAGQSCECDLDRSWMRGPRIPLRWDQATRDRAAQRLGFDADSPMVKSEVSSILARGRGGGGASAAPATPSVEELLLGYSEVVVETVAETANEEPAPASQPTKPAVTVDSPTVSPLLVLLWVGGGLCGLCLAAGGILLWRRRLV